MISSVTVPKPKPLFPKNVKSVMENTMEKIANKDTSISKLTFFCCKFLELLLMFLVLQIPFKKPKSNFQ